MSGVFAKHYRHDGGPMCECCHQQVWHGDTRCGGLDSYDCVCACPGFELHQEEREAGGDGEDADL